MKTVTVVTAFYYGNKYIQSMLESLQVNYENCFSQNIMISSIIVNDSPDCPVKFRDMDYNFEIKVINNKNNMGIHASRIRGINCSNADFVIMLDQDDILPPMAILNQVKAIGDKDVCVGNGMKIEFEKKYPIFNTKYYQMMTENINVYLKYGTPIISPGQCLIRRQAVSNVWLNNPINTNGADDEVLWILMLLENKKFCVNFKDVYHHIATGKNTSDDYGAMASSSLEGVSLFEQQGIMTKKQKNIFIRRRNMKKQRYNSSMVKKILLSIKNFDLSIYIIYVKIAQKCLKKGDSIL